MSEQEKRIINGLTIDLDGLDEKAIQTLVRSIERRKGVAKVRLWESGLRPLKRLPRDENGQFLNSFWGNGNKFIVAGKDTGIGFDRWTELGIAEIPLAFNRTVQGIYDYFKETNSIIHRAPKNTLEQCNELFTKILIRNQAFIDGVAERTQERYDFAFYVCSFFMMRADEDPAEWSKEQADRNIEDWKAERYNPEDFFLFAMGQNGFVVQMFNTQLEIVKESKHKARAALGIK